MIGDRLEIFEMKSCAILFAAAGFFFLGCDQGKALDLKLPKMGTDSVDSRYNRPMASRLVILVFGNTDIYAYKGSYIGSGKKYRYQDLTDLLKAQETDTNFMVVIKPAKNCTYKNTVDMLDEMKIADVKRYALVDITDQEQNFLDDFRQ